MANREACELFIEQEIKDSLAQGKKPYSIGKELAKWIEKLFETSINPRTIEQRVRRIADATFVAENSKSTEISTKSLSSDEEEKSNLIENRKRQGGGAREGAGRPGVPCEEWELPENFNPWAPDEEDGIALRPSVSHARILRQLHDPDLQVKAWGRAIELARGGKVTAKHVDIAVRQMKPTQRQPRQVGYGTPEKIVMSPEFKKAYDAFHTEVCNAKALGWRTTDKDTAVRYVNNILVVITS